MACRRIYLPPNGGDNWCQRDIFAAYRKCLIDSCKSLAGGGFARFKVVIWLTSFLRKITPCPKASTIASVIEVLAIKLPQVVRLYSRPDSFKTTVAATTSAKKIWAYCSDATSDTRFCRHDHGYVL